MKDYQYAQLICNSFKEHASKKNLNVTDEIKIDWGELQFLLSMLEKMESMVNALSSIEKIVDEIAVKKYIQQALIQLDYLSVNKELRNPQFDSCIVKDELINDPDVSPLLNEPITDFDEVVIYRMFIKQMKLEESLDYFIKENSPLFS
ncbi:hypothetical protein [Bacillus cihuensis]|uniref:hypothetical protein n=1 Tax=Bacillus cihuensis TaxID=1208599 RepID=UPI00040560EB|nr:hypothetical protein [Bacillus cihuensis]